MSLASKLIKFTMIEWGIQKLNNMVIYPSKKIPAPVLEK